MALMQTSLKDSLGESDKARLLRLKRILDILTPSYPVLKPLLNHSNPWELLVGTVLSAQCTDKRVNTITPEIFARWKGPAELAEARQEDLERVIYSAGFYRAKARNLIGSAQRIMEDHGGEVPKTMEELSALPGLGRKSAGVLLSACFNTPAIIVDTHFRRVTRRLGLTDEMDPVKLEKDIASWLPPDLWNQTSMFLNFHGRDFCHSRKPNCPPCPIRGDCPQAIA